MCRHRCFCKKYRELLDTRAGHNRREPLALHIGCRSTVCIRHSWLHKGPSDRRY